MKTNRPSYAVFFAFNDDTPRKQVSKPKPLSDAMARRQAFEDMAQGTILESTGQFVVVNLLAE